MVWQFLNGLLVGAKTCIYSTSLMLEPHNILDCFNRDRVTILQLVPTYLETLLECISDRSEKNFEHLSYLSITGAVVVP